MGRAGELPPVQGASPRLGGGGATPRQEAFAAMQDAALGRQPEHISNWMPHDVAEWLYTQVPGACCA